MFWMFLQVMWFDVAEALIFFSWTCYFLQPVFIWIKVFSLWFLHHVLPLFYSYFHFFDFVRWPVLCSACVAHKGAMHKFNTVLEAKTNLLVARLIALLRDLFERLIACSILWLIEWLTAYWLIAVFISRCCTA